MLSSYGICFVLLIAILLTKVNFTQNKVALSYHGVRGLYFLAVIFAATVQIFFML